MTDTYEDAPAGSAPNIRIRPAQPDDAASISLILAQAFPSLYTWTFGRLSTQQTANLLCALYRAGTLALATTQVAEEESCIVGVAILHVGESIGRGTMGAYWKVIWSQLGLTRAVRAFAGGVFANFAINKRIPKGDDLVYIEGLAVTEGARGRGVGARLLTESAAWGVARNRPRMALHVLQSNAGARRLYERMGFRLAHPEPRPAPSGSRRQGWVSLLMTREPAPFSATKS